MKRRGGFTIVELLIVIVVIAILATISIVAYTGVQQRARDTKRKDDLAKIVKAFQLWAAEDGGNFDSMSAGSGGSEIGWFDGVYTTYPTVASVLVGSGYLSNGIVDPINRRSPAGDAYAYMITTCDSAVTNVRVVLARLETPPANSVQDQLPMACSSSSLAGYITTYSMNYAKLVDLR